MDWTTIKNKIREELTGKERDLEDSSVLLDSLDKIDKIASENHQIQH